MVSRSWKPMPRYACLELLGFVGQLKQTHRRLLCRMDVIKTLLTVLVRFLVCVYSDLLYL